LEKIRKKKLMYVPGGSFFISQIKKT